MFRPLPSGVMWTAFFVSFGAIVGTLVAFMVAAAIRWRSRAALRRQIVTMSFETRASVLMRLQGAGRETRKIVQPLIRELAAGVRGRNEVAPAAAPPGRGNEPSPPVAGPT